MVVNVTEYDIKKAKYAIGYGMSIISACILAQAIKRTLNFPDGVHVWVGYSTANVWSDDGTVDEKYRWGSEEAIRVARLSADEWGSVKPFTFEMEINDNTYRRV